MSIVKKKAKRVDLLLANKMEFNLYSNIKEKLSLITSIFSKKLLFGLIKIQKLCRQTTNKSSENAFQLIASTNAT
jgi:hypothetical protein